MNRPHGAPRDTEEQASAHQGSPPECVVRNAWLKDQYATEVQARTGMSVDEFESALRDSMLDEKFRELVTDGITVGPLEIAQEFRWRNELDGETHLPRRTGGLRFRIMDYFA